MVKGTIANEEYVPEGVLFLRMLAQWSASREIPKEIATA